MAEEGPLTAAQIYDQVTGGEGIGSLSDAQQAADELTQRLADRGKHVYALTQKTRAGWTGAGGDAAAMATVPLVQASADDAAHLARAQSAVSDQMAAFGTAKNTVKPVAPQQPELTSEDLRNVLVDKGWGSYNTKIANWQADSQANIDAFSSYHAASTQNGTQMPTEYAQLTDSGSSISMAPADSQAPKKQESHPPGGPQDGRPPGGAVEWMDQRNPGAPGPGQPGPGQPGPSQPGQGQPGHGQPGPGPGPGQPGQPNPSSHAPGQPGSDETKANNYVPKPVMPPAASAGYQFGPTGEPISNLGGTPGYSGGYGPNGGFGPGSGGFGPGTGGYSPGTGGYRNPGGVNEPGRGMGPGSGARTPEERMAGGRGGVAGQAGARGANGMPMGAPGGGRGKKEEDKEKKAAAYLQNPDPDETFGGTEVKPMPPVIGERQQKR